MCERPTLGSILRRPAVALDLEQRRLAARWRMEMRVLDAGARREVAARLAASLDAVVAGRRLDRVAVDLRLVAAVCDAALQARMPAGRCGLRHGPAEVGWLSSSCAKDELSRNERHEFRAMAANADVVERVIAESSDESPASRRKVMAAIDVRRDRQVVDARRDRHVFDRMETIG